MKRWHFFSVLTLVLIGIGFFLGAQIASLTHSLTFSPPVSSFRIDELLAGESISFTLESFVLTENMLDITYTPTLSGQEIRDSTLQVFVRDDQGMLLATRTISFSLPPGKSSSHFISVPVGTDIRFSLSDGRSEALARVYVSFPPAPALSPPSTRSLPPWMLFVLFGLFFFVVVVLFLFFRRAHHATLFARYGRGHEGGFIPVRHP
jgi:hypothetical protein